MIRAVLDANVIVSGFPAHTGTVAVLIDRWRAGAYHVVASEHILSAVARAWAKPYWRGRLSDEQIDGALSLLRADAEIVVLTISVRGITTHAEDDLVLATAVNGAVDYLITGDKELRRLGTYRAVAIVTPLEFLDILDAQD